jgi:hypothetical protein
MRSLIIAAWLALAALTAVPASAAVSVSIGFNIPAYPRLVAIPGYPVYYAPDLNANYFFYDGMYWYFDGVSWYDSPWYNGPWTVIDPFYVPSFILRVPVRYYHRPPVWFRGWRADLAPRWHEHWGRDWVARRPDWNRWDHRNVPRPAPLPAFQQRFSANSYPTPAQQAQIHAREYRYAPREAIVQEHFRNFGQQRAAEVHERNAERREERRDERRERR